MLNRGDERLNESFFPKNLGYIDPIQVSQTLCFTCRGMINCNSLTRERWIKIRAESSCSSGTFIVMKVALAGLF